VNKSRNNTRKSKYTEALEQLDHAEKISRNLNDDELFERIYFNKALTYKKIETYGESIKYLKILRDKFKIKDEKKLIGIKMLLANCFNEQHEFENAEKEYISILEPAMKLNDKDFVAQAYRNLSELYFNQENYKDAAVYIKESLKNNTGNGHLAENLTFAAKVVKNINEDPEIYLLQALDICEKKDKENLNLIENIIYELVLVYKDREDEDNLDIMINKTEELNIEYDLIFPVLVEYYRYTNEEKSKKLNRKQIDKTIIRKKF
jgi:tetratricopeptide (TPR) repeat protein